MLTLVCRWILPVALAILANLFNTQAFAQVTLALESLPNGPEELTSLVRRAQVTFVEGTTLLDSSVPADREQLNQLPNELLDSLRPQRSDAKNNSQTPDRRTRSGLAAITAYRIEFRFSRQRHWDWDTASREMTIHMKARLRSWQPIHTIWFRQSPEIETFWENQLVRHELDHVQLSNDESMRKRFASLLQEGNRQVHKLAPNQVPSDQLADELTDRWIHQQFGEIVKLINIRYRELDRITFHGTQALPEDSSLSDLLRPNR